MTTIKATKPARTPVGAIIYPTGAPGKDGVGIASVEQTTTSQEGGGVNVITVTKTNGETTVFEVRNGKDGVGIASVEQTTTSQEGGGVNVVTVTKADGETSTFEIRNGQDGYTPVKGKDYTDGQDGTDGKDGEDGHTPVRGTDYWTDDDKDEIVNAVLEALPAAEGVSV